MLDINFIKDNLETVKSALKSKNVRIDLDELMQKDLQRREMIQELDDLRAQKNAANDEISQLIKSKQDPKQKIDSMKAIAAQIDQIEPKVKAVQSAMHDVLIGIPNLPHESVPVGGIEQNQITRTWGELKKFSFTPKTHIDIAERLDIIDFKRATKLSGSNFILFKKEGARLERALYNFMLDYHTEHHGYEEVFPPFLVNRESMTGTGQLPKMAEDMYKMAEDDLYLIPTAEVPVTNIHRDEILNEEDLPIKYTAYTACFRREAGSYGKDTRGLIRVHQFDKVELVKFVRPETSYDELEDLVGHAEKIFQLLELPYRVLTLATGDLSFAAAKCYDIEAHAAGLGQWLEVSSCSNFEDFQARRANIRYKGNQSKKTNYVHTLNGSGLALARTMVAILENYQTENGDVIIPTVLQPYMGGLKIIKKDRG